MVALICGSLALELIGQNPGVSNLGEWTSGPTLPVRQNYYILKYKQVWGMVAPSGKLTFLVGGNWPVSSAERKDWDALGFNTHGPLVKGPHSVPFITQSESGGPLKDGFADVFNPSWQPTIDAFWKQQAIEPDNPLWLGSIVDPGFKFGSQKGWRAVADLVRADPSGTFSQRAREFAKQRFSRIERLNTAWGTQYADFDSVVLRPEAESNESEKLFVHAFGSLWFETYIKSIARSMVAAMPGRMYFGYNMPIYEDDDRRMFIQFAAHAIAIRGSIEEFEARFAKPGFGVARPYLIFITGTSEKNPASAAKKWGQFVTDMAQRSEIVGVILDVSPADQSPLAPFSNGQTNPHLAMANRSITEATFRARFKVADEDPE